MSDHRAAKHDRLGKRTGLEQAHFVEGAVVGQFVLEARRLDLALVEQGDPVEQRAVLDEDRADQHRRAAIGRRPGQQFQLSRGAFDQGRLEDQVLGRIADQVELREHHQVRSPASFFRRALARGEHCRGIAGKVAHGVVGLGKGDLERIGHGTA
jgi:hypothetical protein